MDTPFWNNYGEMFIHNSVNCTHSKASIVRNYITLKRCLSISTLTQVYTLLSTFIITKFSYLLHRQNWLGGIWDDNILLSAYPAKSTFNCSITASSKVGKIDRFEYRACWLLTRNELVGYVMYWIYHTSSFYTFYKTYRSVFDFRRIFPSITVNLIMFFWGKGILDGGLSIFFNRILYVKDILCIGSFFMWLFFEELSRILFKFVKI